MKSTKRHHTVLSYIAVALGLILLSIAAVILSKPGITPYNLTAAEASDVSFADPAKASASTTITTGSLSSSSAISRYDFGADEVWYDGGYGAADPITGQPYSQLVSLEKQIGITIMRYPGGNPSDIFNWEDAIGPQSSRTPSLVDGGYPPIAGDVGSVFGPDELGELMDDTGSAADITVNFGTGSAQEATDWVCYMTAPVNDKTDPACDQWAALRAKYGHPAPYNVPYWEVGNEPYVDQYWKAGTVVSSPGNCKTRDYACLYVFGGTTKFTNQPLAETSVQTNVNAGSSRAYFVTDPPIDTSQPFTITTKSPSQVTTGAKTETVMQTASWNQVSASALSSAPASAFDYSLNTATGQVTFGDGTHGHALPSGAQATATYVSGPHAGFNTFYADMKKADPSAKICDSYWTQESMKDGQGGSLAVLGKKYPYDCYVLHNYGIVGGLDDYSADQFHDQIMLVDEHYQEMMNQTNQEIAKYAGSKNKVSIAMTEYGVFNSETPADVDIEAPGSVFAGQSDYHRSMDLGLFVANMLRNAIVDHVPLAEKHYLVGYNFSNAPGLQGSFNAHNFSGNAMIDTVAPTCSATSCSQPEFVAQPSAYVFELYTHMLYDRMIDSSVKDVPDVIVPADTDGNKSTFAGTYPDLETLATTDGSGGEALLVINDSVDTAVSANLNLSSNDYKSVTASTLGGNGFLNFNTLDDPNAVGISQTTSNLYNGKLIANFPASSVTVLKFSKTAPTCSTSPTVPADFQASNSNSSQVTLSWQPSKAGTNCSLKDYNVYENGKAVTTTTGTSYTFNGLAAKTTYSFNVSAADTNGHTSAETTTLKVTTKAASTPPPPSSTTPTAPTNLQSLLITSTAVSLSWSPSTVSSGSITNYVVAENQLPVATTNASTTFDIVNALTPDKTYRFEVLALSSKNKQSPASATLTIKTVTPHPATGSKCTIGDFNNNQYNVVGIIDFSILASHFGEKATSCQGALSNPGEVVNVTDLSQFDSNFTGGGTGTETGGN